MCSLGGTNQNFNHLVCRNTSISIPHYKKGTLREPLLPSRYFLHFAGGFFVEMDGMDFSKCLDTGSCSGAAPLQYADKNSGCHIAQYFGEGKAECSHRKTSRRSFLLHTGESIIYTLLDPITLRFSCGHQGNDSIKRVLGRGVTNIPKGCKVNTNKAIFPPSRPERIVIETNLSLGGPISVGSMSLGSRNDPRSR